MKHIFMLSNFFKPNLITHASTERAVKDTPKALEDLRHSRALGEHSESTQRAPRHLESTRALGGHSEGTRALKALGHLDT